MSTVFSIFVILEQHAKCSRYALVCSSDLSRTIQQYEENARSQKAALDAQMSKCAQLVAEAYDRCFIVR